jgi:hypothetical protein
MDNSESMALDLFLDLLNNARNEQDLSTVQPNSKSILAVLYPELTKKYSSLHSFPLKEETGYERRPCYYSKISE